MGVWKHKWMGSPWFLCLIKYMTKGKLFNLSDIQFLICGVEVISLSLLTKM